MSEWQVVTPEEERKPDALDRAIANIARALRDMRQKNVLCSESIFKKLRKEYMDCLDKSETLCADERFDANEILTQGLLEGSLLDMLKDIIAERKNRIDNDDAKGKASANA